MTRPAAQEGDTSTGRPQRRRRRSRGQQSGESTSQSPLSDRSGSRRKRAEEAVSDASSSSGSADGTSPTYSSPLCVPRLHYQLTGYTSDGEGIYKPIDDDMSVLREYDDKDSTYRKKLGRRMKLPTLDMNIPFSFLDKEKMVPIRATATKTILSAAKSVLALSSFIGDRQLPRCSGFLIEWDAARKEGIVVTSADLICSSKSMDDWSGKDVHCRNAKVYVHLLDNTTVEGCLIYFQTDYNLAFFKISVDQHLQLLHLLNQRLEYAQAVFLLGRDESLYLGIGHGRVLCCDPNLANRHHYMNVDATAPECVTGGPAIDYNGEVVGMASLYARQAIIPSFIIFKCWHFWKRFNCIPRPHLGLKFSSIKFRSVPQIDKISRDCKIEDGLIVQEVSEESIAEGLGVRIGDIVTSFNGECISDTVELESMLLSMSEAHFDQGNRLNSKMNVNIGVFHMSNRAQRDIPLSVNVSDKGEVVLRRSYLVNPPSGQELPVPPCRVQRWLCY